MEKIMKISVVDRFGNERMLDERIAKILQRSGRITYQTRDMQAVPLQSVQEAAAPSFEPAAAPASSEPQFQAAAADDLDSSGAAWDERMHSSAKARNTDGTWRKRPGPRTADE